MIQRTIFPTVILTLIGCGSPVVKPGALDERLLDEPPAASLIAAQDEHEERSITASTAWLCAGLPETDLVFAGYDGSPGRYHAVVACDPARDELVLLPLDAGVTPLDVVADDTRAARWQARVRAARADAEAAGVLRLSFEEAVGNSALRSPLPEPGRIYAVAANFPSHLEYDLALRLNERERDRLRRARARVFIKYPPTAPAAGRGAALSMTIRGPFDPLVYNASLLLPAIRQSSPPPTTINIDYEAEIGVVLGRDLTWTEVRDADDATLLDAVAGVVLMTDTKSRNPQVVDKIADEERQRPADPSPYLIGDRRLDHAAGWWDRRTCLWWSYAASAVDTAIGPFFVAPRAGQTLLDRSLISGRSYADSSNRPLPGPRGRAADVLYLRQLTRVTADPDYRDALVWDVPDIIRSITNPEANALDFAGPTELAAGDIICLGTPGGVVLTSKPAAVFSLLHDLLFWWSPRKWHDTFFERDAPLYLLPGDELFHWATGLGYQRHAIQGPNP